DWSQQFGRGRAGKLTAQLSKPISPKQDVTLLVSARRRRAPIGDTLRSDDLAMLRISNTDAARRIVDVQAAEGYQLQLRGADEVGRLDPAQLSDADAAVFSDGLAGFVFVADESARSLAVSLAAKQAVFEADIHAEVAVADESVTESYRFSLAPQGRDLGRFTVRFSQPH